MHQLIGRRTINKKDSLSFGYYLKAVRVENGISLKEVSEKTRIRMNILLSIEKEDHDRLPAKVFVKGFLRAYAKAVGADENRPVQSYLESLHAFQEPARLEAKLTEYSRAFWRRLLLSSGTLAAIIVLSVFAVSIFEEKFTTGNRLNQQTVNKSLSLAEKGNNHDVAIKEYTENISERLLLKIVTVEDTWIRIIINGQSPKEYSLRPKDRLELEASLRFNLLIGNAAGVKLTLNGKPVEVLGRRGQVVNILIP